MDIEILPQHWSSIIILISIFVIFLVFYIKKWMMTYALIFSNFAVFIITIFFYKQIVYGLNFSDVFEYAGLGFRPIYLTSQYSPQIYTLFTSMFIHGGFLHLLGNMLIFLFIGLPFEQRIGGKKFLLIYFLAGVFGTLIHAYLDTEFFSSFVPLIGASGAIFGIMGAFAFSYPRDKILVPVGYFIAFLVRIKVMYAVVIYAALETLIILWESNSGMVSNTAHFAHIGGLIGGGVLAALLLRKTKKHYEKTGETIFYDSYTPKFTDVDLKVLENLAITSELKEQLDRIKNESVPQVRDVWIENFLEKTVCPKCKKELNHFDGKIWCEYCGFKTDY